MEQTNIVGVKNLLSCTALNCESCGVPEGVLPMSEQVSVTFILRKCTTSLLGGS